MKFVITILAAISLAGTNVVASGEHALRAGDTGESISGDRRKRDEILTHCKP
jgi:hypothetical protein